MYDVFNIPVTYDTAPDVVKQIIDKHEDDYHQPLLTITCVSVEGAGGEAIEKSRYTMIFNAQKVGFIVDEVWLNPDDTIRTQSEIFIANDEAGVIAEFLNKQRSS